MPEQARGWLGLELVVEESNTEFSCTVHVMTGGCFHRDSPQPKRR
jgi:hypothetical protein